MPTRHVLQLERLLAKIIEAGGYGTITFQVRKGKITVIKHEITEVEDEI